MKRRIHVTLAVMPALVDLMRSSLRCTVISRTKVIGTFHALCYLNLLPLIFDTTLDTIPNRVPYLTAPKRKTPPSPKPVIGLCWQGNLKLGPERSIPEAQLRSLERNNAFEFRSLQHMPGQTSDSFADRAAEIAGYDLVISVDTSIAHLAGALAKPVWVLLPYHADWRWMLDRSDSPWYPTARLFRQSRPGDWQSVLEQLPLGVVGQANHATCFGHGATMQPP